MFLSLPAPRRKAGQLADSCSAPGTAREGGSTQMLQKQEYSGAEQSDAADDV